MTKQKQLEKVMEKPIKNFIELKLINKKGELTAKDKIARARQLFDLVDILIMSLLTYKKDKEFLIAYKSFKEKWTEAKQ